MIRKQSPRQKIRNRARYWDSDYLAGFIILETMMMF